jgi:peptide/nickel transport system substrate-binding protein
MDRVELVVDEDQSSRIAAFLSGKYDLGTEFMGTINRPDWNQLKDQLAKHRPGLRTLDLASNVRVGVTMRSDRPPFSDVRVRRALSLALNRPALIEAVADGAAVVNPPGLPLALKDWSLPVNQLGEGAQYYKHDPAEARRLLAQAGYARGFATVVDFHSFGETALVDGAQVLAKDLKEIGVEARLNQREYGAYIATAPLGKYEGIVWGPSTPFLEPDSFLASAFLPDSPRNNMKVNDPPLTDMLLRQRRIQDPAKRRELILDIQRYLAKMVYRAEAYSTVLPAVWDPALKNYGPNLGYDYGGRLMAAWLDR